MDFAEIERRIAEHDKDAGMFISQIMSISATWDHLVDRDVPVSNNEIDNAFQTALIGLPRNQFYVRNFSDLNPIMVLSIKNWQIANLIENNNSSKDQLDISFIIRSSYIDLVTITALLVGGDEFSKEIGLMAREFVHREGRQKYEVNLFNELQSRNKEVE